IVGPDEDRPRLLRAYGKACGGEFAFVMRPSEGRAVLVHVTKAGAKFWKAAASADSPLTPSIDVSPGDAIAMIKVEQKAVPKEGPTTLRGRWTGAVRCDDAGKPTIELVRKLAAYGTLTITSAGEAGWSWSFDRVAKWFG